MEGNSMFKRISSLIHVGGAYLNVLRICVYVEVHLLFYWCVYPFSPRYARKISRRVLNDSFQGEIKEAIAWLEEVADNDVFRKGD